MTHLITEFPKKPIRYAVEKVFVIGDWVVRHDGEQGWCSAGEDGGRERKKNRTKTRNMAISTPIFIFGKIIREKNRENLVNILVQDPPLFKLLENIICAVRYRLWLWCAECGCCGPDCGWGSRSVTVFGRV